ncbi:MAG TPA: alpha/beta hydrolase, partial [Prochlorococcaceae cyanobacterium Gl_MAG_24]|nr:alpha/beta hydrolase [Prochlorococcaceae cyanobacterium Gl_MAG_24]
MLTDVASVARPHRPLVLVHGLWDTPKLFGRLVKVLEQHQVPLLIPHLPHRLGVVPLSTLANTLDALIVEQWGSEMVIDV